MVSFESLKFNPQIKGANPFAPGKVAFAGGGAEGIGTAEYSERHGNGKAAGVNSTGVYGETEGCGKNGDFVLKNLYA